LAILEERDRIGREMHDGLAQVLGFVNTKAQAVREFLRAGQQNTAAFHVDELIGAAREAYTEARQAIADLRTEGVAERPLADLVAESLTRLERQAGTVTRLDLAPGWDEAAVSASMRVQLLRIVQEALSNARRHARAKTVSVSLALVDGQVRVTVADDGAGFHLSHLLSPQFSHFGLRTMRERAQAMGGTFRIESLPGEGTRLFVGVPVDSDPAEPAAPAARREARP
jgi:signal transduction histidine kinase